MKPTLTDITGIGPSTAKDLAEGGILTVEDLANATSTVICAVPGFGAIRAARIKAAAAELLRRSASAAAQVESTDSTPEPSSELDAVTWDLEATEVEEVDEIKEEGKPKKKKAGKKDKKDKKSGKGKKDKGKSKKDKAGKKGKSRGTKDKKSSGK